MKNQKAVEVKKLPAHLRVFLIVFSSVLLWTIIGILCTIAKHSSE